MENNANNFFTSSLTSLLDLIPNIDEVPRDLSVFTSMIADMKSANLSSFYNEERASYFSSDNFFSDLRSIMDKHQANAETSATISDRRACTEVLASGRIDRIIEIELEDDYI